MALIDDGGASRGCELGVLRAIFSTGAAPGARGCSTPPCPLPLRYGPVLLVTNRKSHTVFGLLLCTDPDDLE